MELERASRRIEAMKAIMVADVQSSLSFLDDAHHNSQAWLKAVTNTTPGAARSSVQIATLLAERPDVAVACFAGQIGSAQLRVLADLSANERCRDQFGTAEAELLDAASDLVFRDFRKVCDRFRAHADPDGNLADHELSRENRKATLSQVGAGFVFHAEGDALSGEIMDEILKAHAEAEYLKDIADREARYGEHACNHPLARNTAQRQFDALQVIFAKAASTRDIADLIPTVNIVCTEQSLAQIVRDSFGTPGVPADRSWREHLCETSDGTPVNPKDLLTAALLGKVRRVIIDSAGRVIDLGRKSRVFTGAAREAVLLSGDRCSWPGCEMRIAGIQIDHLQPWARARGDTHPCNGGPNCGHHNRAKHNQSISVIRDRTGWHYYRPDGTEIAPRRAA